MKNILKTLEHTIVAILKQKTLSLLMYNKFQKKRLDLEATMPNHYAVDVMNDEKLIELSLDTLLTAAKYGLPPDEIKFAFKQYVEGIDVKVKK